MRLKRPVLAPLVTGLVTGLVSAVGAAPATPAHAHPTPSVLAQVPPAPPAPTVPAPAPAPAPNAPNATIAQRVVTLVAEKLVVDAALVVPSADLRKDLGGDSIDLVELVMALESEFAFTIADDDAEKLLTVGDIISYCEHHAK